MSDIYEFHVKGHLDRCWSDCFDGLGIHHQEDGRTLLIGPVPDQAALHGVLAKIRDLGLRVLEVKRTERSHEM